MLYARVSSAEQELGYSIPAQQKFLRDYANHNGMAVEQEFVDVETAKAAGRTGFQAMIAHFKRHQGCRVLLVEKVDRLCRNFADIAAVEALGIEVHLVKENMIVSKESRAADKFMHAIKVAMSKHYIDNLSEEVKKGQRTKAAQGLWPSYAPLGYQNTVSADQKRIIEPHPVLGPMITNLFEWFATAEYSLKALAQRAYQEGFRFRKSQGKVPTTTLHKILRNRIYMGEFDFGGVRYQGIHQPLVSRPVWERVQEILLGRSKKKHRKVTHEFAYSGMVCCGHCGCSMVGEVKKSKYVYYHCTGYRGKCGEPYTPERILEQEFAAGLKGLCIPPATLRWLEAELVESERTEQAALEQALRRHESEMARSETRLDVLYEDRLDGRIDAATYDRKAKEIREQQSQIQGSIENAQAKLLPAQNEEMDLSALTTQAGDLFVQQAAAEQRKLLHVVVKEAAWKGGALTVSLREPFAAFCPARDEVTTRNDVGGV